MNELPTPTDDQRSADQDRRAILGGALTGTAGLVAALATGASSAQPAPQRAGRFTGRVVLITGATSGIGEGTARAFAREGAKVVFNGRRAHLGRQVQDSINADPATRAAFYVQSDVRQEDQVRRFVAAAVERYGAVHIAFNNAGVVFGNGKASGSAPIGDVPTADFDDVWATNTRGIFLSMKHELPVLLRNEPWGRFGLRGVIVNTASVSGHGGFPGIGPYSTSKHGVNGLTRDAALDYGGRGVRINSISPGGVDTPMRALSIRAQGGNPTTSAAPNIQYRTNTVEEMADVVLFLADADAPSAIMGTDIDVTMGMLTGPFAPPKPPA